MYNDTFVINTDFENYENKTDLNCILEKEVNDKYYVNQDKVSELISKHKPTWTVMIDGSYNIRKVFITRKTLKQLNENIAPCLSIGGHGNGNHSNMLWIVEMKMKYPEITKIRNRKFYVTLDEPVYENVYQFDDFEYVSFEVELRIRRLTERESFRLMGVDETDIDILMKTGISSSGLYKLSGNSIVVNVINDILRNLIIEPKKKKKENKLF